MKASARDHPAVAGAAEVVQAPSGPFGRLNFPGQPSVPAPEPRLIVPKPPAATSRMPEPVPRLVVPKPPPDAPAAAAAVEAAEPEPTPIDSAKAFVGPNATFYDDRWRWMDWRGRHRSWNWAAALTFGGWFAYRRMYGYAAACSAWLLLMVGLAASGWPLGLLAGTQLVLAVALGLYGDKLYLLRYRRTAAEVFREHPEYEARVAALTKAGGVNRRAVWVLAIATLSLGAALVAGLVMTEGYGLTL